MKQPPPPLALRAATGKGAAVVEGSGNIWAGENRVYEQDTVGDVKVGEAFKISSERIQCVNACMAVVPLSCSLLCHW